MADIRIKDITTTASASLTGDFLPIDGSTGTRKLSAFSPTFGGNATVTGTLTVNGTGTNSIPNLSVTGIAGLNVAANFLTSANTLKFSDSASGGLTWSMSPQLGDGVATNFAFYSNDGVTSTPLFRVTSAGVFRLPSTTASTTTSTGALVVGNGTSGGLGVGGSINAGGNVTISGSNGYAVIGGRQWSFRANSSGGSPASGCVIRDDSAAADRLTIDINGNTTVAGEYLQGSNANFNITSTATSGNVYIKSNGGNLYLNNTVGNGDIRLGNTGTVAYVIGTSASTSTSSGALVVSGGVGVAGAVNAGDQIKSERTSGTDTASAVLGVLTTTGAGVTNSFGIDARVIVNNSSGTTTSATGLRALSRVSNVSTVTQAVAMLAQVDNPGGGTITTAYGLYVNPITAGGTNYAIYTGGGRINFQSLPTSSAGLAAGTIWNDAGTLKVA